MCKSENFMKIATSNAYVFTLWYMFYMCFSVDGIVGFWMYLNSWTAAHATPWSGHLQYTTNKTWPGFLLALRFSQMQVIATRSLPQLSHLVFHDKTKQNNAIPRNHFPSYTSDMDAIDLKWVTRTFSSGPSGPVPLRHKWVEFWLQPGFTTGLVVLGWFSCFLAVTSSYV